MIAYTSAERADSFASRFSSTHKIFFPTMCTRTYRLICTPPIHTLFGHKSKTRAAYVYLRVNVYVYCIRTYNIPAVKIVLTTMRNRYILIHALSMVRWKGFR